MAITVPSNLDEYPFTLGATTPGASTLSLNFTNCTALVKETATPRNCAVSFKHIKMEDAPEEDLDIKLQTVSKDLIAEFDARLRPFLRKADGSGRVRSRVRAREVSHLMSNVGQHCSSWFELVLTG